MVFGQFASLGLSVQRDEASKSDRTFCFSKLKLSKKIVSLRGT